MKKFNWHNLFWILIILAISWRPLGLVIHNWESYAVRIYHFNYPAYKRAYYASQYMNKKPTGTIPDETLEAFAGGIFLTGLNPILIVHDQPPLGRYLISLSIYLFDNEKTIPVMLLLISAVGMYLTAAEIIPNRWLALIPVGIFINEPMFLHKFNIIPLLEPIQLPFIIFAIYFFLLAIKSHKPAGWFIGFSVMIGFVVSIRYFVVGAAITGAAALFLLCFRKFNRLLSLILSLPLALVILLLSYYRTFRSGYTLIKVLGIQKYILMYHKSAFVNPFTVWDLLLFNRWHTWWANNAILSDPEWTILWPLAGFMIVIGGIWLWRKRVVSQAETVILFWIILYSLMLSVGYTSTRYFLPLIPYLYILATGFAVKISAGFMENRKNQTDNHGQNQNIRKSRNHQNSQR
jgi:hypothetical protein